jgi:hypothetical protein
MKNLAKMRPNPFFVKINTKLLLQKSSPKMLVTLVMLKNYPKKIVAQWAKFRPIWSPWL